MEQEAYSIVLVDDEKWALVYLKSVFDRPDLGFRVAASCRQSLEAVGVIEREKPDVVVTDIRMPELGGIQLIEHLRHIDIDCEVVIVSGFADFSYAQQAISLGAFAYLLKPASADDVAETLGKLRQKLDGARPAAASDGEDLAGEEKTAFDELLQYIEGNFRHRLYLKDLAPQFGLAPNYCCALFLKATGMTFSHYVTGLRMKKAARLLENPEVTVARVAQLVGFDDSTYFNRVFKRAFGATPTEYRREKSGIV